MIHCKEEDVLLPEEKSLSLSVEDERGNAVGVGIFSHLTIRSDSDSGSHNPIPERFLIYPPLLIN